jgi:pimeloyl-ACP methyl ester carboxylesterase
LRLPHDEAGSGAALVLLHAGVADRSMWAEHLEPLAAAGYRCVAIDLPGSGEARPEPGEQAAWLDVLETMDGLAVERAALVGNSFGGEVALRVAHLAPERVSALALISVLAPEAEPSPRLEAAWAAEETALERGDVDAAVAAVVEAWTLPDAGAALRAQVAAMQRRAFGLQADVETSDAADPLEEDPAALARIEAPALLAYGEHDPPDFRVSAERMSTALPHARLAVIEGAGHLAPLEAPKEFRELLLEFLR